MRSFKTVGSCLFLVVSCILTMWGAIAVGQDSGPVALPADVGGSTFRSDAPMSAPTWSTVPLNSEPLNRAWMRLTPSGTPSALGRLTTRAPSVDPLKDVSDLASGQDTQLQQADAYLNSHAWDLRNQYMRAEDLQGRAKIKTELAITVGRHFDVRHEIRKRQVDELYARVERLREQLEKRGQGRQAIVDRRLQQFVTSAEGLGWDDTLRDHSHSPPRGSSR